MAEVPNTEQSPLKTNSQVDNAYTNEPEDSIVCYCYRLTTKALREAYAKHGSLKAVEEATKVGKGCTGCKVILHSLFGEAATDHYHEEKHKEDQSMGSACSKPGSRTMKGFIVADDNLESVVYSSNAVAPQLGKCDSSATVEFALFNHKGLPVLMRSQKIATNETFIFDTRKEKLERPFHGMFSYTMDRSNYGASRFNIYWSNGKSTTSTHENATTGRPRLVLPILLDRKFAEGPNTLFTGLMNPHYQPIPLTVTLCDTESGETFNWNSTFLPYATAWINVTKHLLVPALTRKPNGKFLFQVATQVGNPNLSITQYFFVHNRTTNTWSANHL